MMEAPQNPANRPLYVVPRPAKRRRGCLRKLPLLLFFLFMVPIFLCGLCLVAYLIIPPPPLDVMVLGIDARPGEGAMSRTDSIVLVGLQPSRLRVSMLSIPRDLFIEAPGYGLQRINAINVLGEMEAEGRGPALLRDSIQQSFGISMERYMRMDFQGFIDLINAVGGVTIDVERTVVDDFYPTADGGTMTIRFDTGVQHMDGERALQYARTRHGDDDYHRAERQQQVISALSSKLLNPANWPSVVSVINRSLDTDVTLWDMTLYAPTVVLNAGRFEREVIDRDFITAASDGSAIPNYGALAPWINERFE